MDYMTSKYNIDIVREKFKERGYELLSTEYINNATHLQYICPKHCDKGILNISFANFIRGKGCPYCAHRAKKTHDEYVQELTDKNPNLEVVGTYVNLRTKILHRCKRCGYKWEIRPDNILYDNQDCAKCAGQVKKTKEEFVAFIAYKNPSVELIGDYIDTATKTMFRCKKCGYEWMAKPNNIENGRACPHCKSSKGEEKIYRFLDKKKILYIREKIFDDCIYINKLPFDFYLPEYNCCIEFDGIQHYKPSRFGGMEIGKANEAYNLSVIKDGIKTKYCYDNGIRLLRIPYWDIENIEQIISSFLA